MVGQGLGRSVATALVLATALVSNGASGQASAQARPRSGKWMPLQNPYPGTFPDLPLLMTDGTVHEGCTPNWSRLTPDKRGNYEKGTWSAVASMPVNYGPLYFASQVLADGRVIVNGGEYNFCNFADTNKGALYDPVSNT